jgi:nitroreductase
MDMDIEKAIKKRSSIRSFTSQKIQKEDLEHLLEIACLAPSAGNLQSFSLLIVEEKKTKDLLAEAAYGQYFISEAPIVIIGCADLKQSAKKYGKRGEELYCVQDTTLVIYTLWLAALKRNLSAAWVGAFSEREVSKILKLPKNLRPIIMLPIGYSKEPFEITKKMHFKEKILNL